MARLTAGQVLDIRARHAAGESQTFLAGEYGVTVQNIWLIVHRRKWAHI